MRVCVFCFFLFYCSVLVVLKFEARACFRASFFSLTVCCRLSFSFFCLFDVLCRHSHQVYKQFLCRGKRCFFVFWHVPPHSRVRAASLFLFGSLCFAFAVSVAYANSSGKSLFVIVLPEVHYRLDGVVLFVLSSLVCFLVQILVRHTAVFMQASIFYSSRAFFYLTVALVSGFFSFIVVLYSQMYSDGGMSAWGKRICVLSIFVFPLTFVCCSLVFFLLLSFCEQAFEPSAWCFPYV